MDSLQGRFLVSDRSLVDSNFFRTVVLIVEHNDNGTMGVVVNRPSGVAIHQAFAKHFSLPESEDMVFVGGPVEPNGLIILHNSPEFDPAEQEIVDGVFLGSSQEAFERMIEAIIDEQPGLTMRVYSGCAGWSPGQLEGELFRNDWHVLPASASQVFADDPYALWDDLIARAYRNNRLIEPAPEHPEWN